MKKYKVRGMYTISFEVEIEAESKYDAIAEGEDLYITESIDNCIFCTDPEVQLYADGMITDVEAEYIGEADEDDDEEDDDDY